MAYFTWLQHDDDDEYCFPFFVHVFCAIKQRLRAEFGWISLKDVTTDLLPRRGMKMNVLAMPDIAL